MSVETPGHNPTLIAPERNLLLIDDDGLIRKTVRRLLGRHFSLIFEAADMPSALQAVNGLGEGDVIISDLHLTEYHHGEGIQIAQITRELRQEKDLTFVLCSSESNQIGLSRIDEQLSAKTIDAFVSKPYDLETMRTTIRGVLRPLKKRQ